MIRDRLNFFDMIQFPHEEGLGFMWHTVVQGECLSSIAVLSGHLPETIWNHPENASFRAIRDDLNVLFPGDRVFVPVKAMQEEMLASVTSDDYSRTILSDRIALRALRVSTISFDPASMAG